MPAFSSHYIFAKELMDSLINQADFELNKDAVLLGTQGPDIFFFARIFPWMIGKPMVKLGSKMHRTKPSLILENMRDYCQNSLNIDTAKSYVYGFILHYALDSNCHPFVYSLENKITKTNPLANPHSVHNTIEFSMDSFMLNKRLGINKPYLFNMSETFNENPVVADEIAKLYTAVLSQLYGYNASEKQIITAIKDTKYFQQITLDKTGIKKAVLKPFEIFLSPFTHNYKLTAFIRPRDLEKAKKYGNIENGPWIYPTADIKSTKSFEQLFDQAKTVSLDIIKAFDTGLSMREATHDKSFLTGVEIK